MKTKSGKPTTKVNVRGGRPSTSSDSSDDSYSDSFSDSDDTSDYSDTDGTDSSDCSCSQSCSSSSSTEECTPPLTKKIKTYVYSTGNRLHLKKSPLSKAKDSSTLKSASKFGGKGRKNTHNNTGNKKTSTKKTIKKKSYQDISETSKSGNAKTSALKRTKKNKDKTVKVKRISSAATRSRSETGSASGESKTRPLAGCKSGMKRSISQSSSANTKLKDTATKCKTAKCSKT